MFESDLKNRIEAIKKRLNRDSKILNLSHNDMDGVSCTIVINNAFKNVTNINTSYDDLLGYLESINLASYDVVLITDLSPDEETGDVIKKHDNIILLDHHESSLFLHSPEDNRFVDMNKSATMMTKYFCESVTGSSLSYLGRFVELVNIYDMWQEEHNDFDFSRELNTLYFSYFDRKFYSRFFEGVIEFTKSEQQIIERKKAEFEEFWNNLDFYVLNSVNVGICDSQRFANDLAYRMMKDEDVDIAIIRNTKTQRMSVRSRVENFSIGEFLRELDLGGGHPRAGAVSYDNITDCRDKLSLIESELHKSVPAVRI